GRDLGGAAVVGMGRGWYGRFFWFGSRSRRSRPLAPLTKLLAPGVSEGARGFPASRSTALGSGLGPAGRPARGIALHGAASVQSERRRALMSPQSRRKSCSRCASARRKPPRRVLRRKKRARRPVPDAQGAGPGPRQTVHGPRVGLSHSPVLESRRPNTP